MAHKRSTWDCKLGSETVIKYVGYTESSTRARWAGGPCSPGDTTPRFFDTDRVRRGVRSSSRSSILMSSSDVSTYFTAPRDRDDVRTPVDVEALVDAGTGGGAIAMLKSTYVIADMEENKIMCVRVGGTHH